MSTADNGVRLRDRCRASTYLTRAEAARVTALPEIVGTVLHALTCELAAGHDGSHVAFTAAVHGGERWWWLRWSDDLRNLVEAEACDRTNISAPERDDCLLPKGHPGPHSFDIAAFC
jgi:hypothetical protein